MKIKSFYKQPRILAIIPARGGSKGIIQKNIKLLGDKPLLAYTIASAKKSKLIDTLILSTDNDKIIKIAKQFKLDVPFIRPEHLALDNSSSIDVVNHAINFYEQKDDFFDAVILLQPTSPFREVGFIDKAIEKFIKGKSDSLVSVLPIPHEYNPHWVYKTNTKGFLEISTGDREIIKRRQELPEAYHRDGSIYITKTNVVKAGSLYGEKISYIISNKKNHVNIDTLEDWHKAELIQKRINK